MLSLVIDPLNPDMLYAGTFGFGVFKSTDAGATWSCIGLDHLNATIGSLAFSNTEPLRLHAATPSGGIYRIDQP